MPLGSCTVRTGRELETEAWATLKSGTGRDASINSPSIKWPITNGEFEESTPCDLEFRCIRTDVRARVNCIDLRGIP